MTVIKHKDNIVIAVVEDGAVKSYYGIDESSGGYPWYPTELSQAKFFKTHEEAEKIVNNLVATSEKPQPPNRDGTIFPHSDISSLLRLSTAKPKASVMLAIVDLMQIATSFAKVSGELKYPTGFKYD